MRGRFHMTNFITTKGVFEKCIVIFFCLTQECCHGNIYSLGPSEWFCVCLCASLGKWSYYCFLCLVNFVEFRKTQRRVQNSVLMILFTVDCTHCNRHRGCVTCNSSIMNCSRPGLIQLQIDIISKIIGKSLLKTYLSVRLNTRLSFHL